MWKSMCISNKINTSRISYSQSYPHYPQAVDNSKKLHKLVCNFSQSTVNTEVQVFDIYNQI